MTQPGSGAAMPGSEGGGGGRFCRCGTCGRDWRVPEEQWGRDTVCPGCGAFIGRNVFIGHYQAVRRIASGGFGEVIEGIDSDTGRRVAIKTLRQVLRSPGHIERFAREAEILAGLSHPNIAEVYGFFEHGGTNYLAMEFVEGGSLLGRIQRGGPVPEEELLRIGMDAVRGLLAALAKRLLHRDIKPANMLFDRHGRIKLVDFGLAVSVEEAIAGMGDKIGSPYYTAPERIEGAPEDFRGDMYSLGVTLFHAAAGRTPFQATDPTVMAWKHLKAQHVSVKTFAPGLSDDTVALINRCMARRPEDRFQSYFDLLAALESAEKRLLFNAPDAKGPPPDLIGASRESSWTLRWLGLGAAAVLLLAGGIFALKSRPGGPDFDKTLAPPADEAAATARRSEEMTGAATLVPERLVAHWRFDETSGDIAVDSEGRCPGTLHNNPARIAGHLGGALQFNGNGQRVELSDNPSDLEIGTGDFSIALWFHCTAEDASIDRNMRLISKEFAGAPGYNIVGSKIWIAFHLGDGATRNGIRTVFSPSDQWDHFTATVARVEGKIRIYVNGQLKGEQDISDYKGIDIRNDSHLTIGAIAHWSGNIDDVRIYKRALTAAEIQAMASR